MLYLQFLFLYLYQHQHQYIHFQLDQQVEQRAGGHAHGEPLGNVVQRDGEHEEGGRLPVRFDALDFGGSKVDVQVRHQFVEPKQEEGAGEEAAAIAYIQIKLANGKTRWGAGVDTNIELASVRAVLSALNRS